MDRNLLLAIALSILIIVGFQLYYQYTYTPPPKPPTDVSQTKKPDAGRTAEGRPESRAPSETEMPEPSRTLGEVQDAEVASTDEAAQERLITVSGPKFEAVLSSRGARIISFKLKKFRQTLESDDLVNLVSTSRPDTSGPTLMLTRRDRTIRDRGLVYGCDADKGEIKLASGEKKRIGFRVVTEEGLSIIKTYEFDADSYAIDFDVKLGNTSNEARSYLVTFPWEKAYLGERDEGDGRFAWNSVEVWLDERLREYYYRDIEGEEELSGNVGWAGLGDTYFLKAMVFTTQPAQRVTLFKPSPQGIVEIWVRKGSVDIPSDQTIAMDMMLYLGPKQRDALVAAGHGLTHALFYSTWGVLDITSEYLMKVLRFLHRGEVFGIRIPGLQNWGVSIILLTIIIKILFIPLTHKSMKSMKRLQEIQPEIAKVKEKYGDDKQKLNEETMRLFKEHKVNPLGGCWPIFLQLPVFIALYQTLSYAIELRHAYFVCIPSIYLCIKDLSAPDPYYVTPIIMGATMMAQQWMTPSGGDPTQRKMMLIMPVVFTYLFISFPAGLVLYWMVSNILSIAQQVITNKLAK